MQKLTTVSYCDETYLRTFAKVPQRRLFGTAPDVNVRVPVELLRHFENMYAFLFLSTTNLLTIIVGLAIYF